ncbi:MAG: VWA domain-containing protein [Proteobacteria bacterium]|nr:VWA domain-containing protein [Pseudomonadota bacterium]MCP4920117.1 VWA domain-containing protein [Pseudomonadota bacterium]
MGPVEDTLGPELGERYTTLVLRAAQAEGRLGRVMAGQIPEHLARVETGARGEYLRLVTLVVTERPQAASMVARNLPELMESLSGAALARFLGSGLDLHEDSSAVAESFLRRESSASQKHLERLVMGLPLKEVSRTLALYARAHCGEDVQVRPIPPGPKMRAFSEGRHLYLPERVDRYGDDRDFTVFRVLTARTAAYLEFGTFDLDLRTVPGTWPDIMRDESDLERLFRAFPNKSLARDLFQVVEDARVESRMVRTYPGLARDIAQLRPDELAERPDLAELAPAEALVEGLLRKVWGQEPTLEGEVGQALEAAWELIEPLTTTDATVGQVAALVPELYPLADALLVKVKPEDLKGPGPTRGSGKKRQNERPEMPGDVPADDEGEGAYEGLEDSALGSAIRPEALGDSERAQDEAARDMREDMEEAGIEATISEIRKAMQQHERGKTDDSSYDEMIAFLERMPGVEGGEVEQPETDQEPQMVHTTRFSGPLELEEDPNARSFNYPEWDVAIEDYKPSWVRVREHTLPPGDRQFVTDVLDEYGNEIRRLRRRFQALRPEELKRTRGWPDGDELDLDRVIDSRVSRRAGRQATDRVYSKHLRNQRDVAVAFLLDMSSSTNESHAGMDGKRIIQIEKEALVMIAEAVDAIGDACAIWGFSGYGREHVAFYVAKDFNDRYDDTVRERIGRITWKMENRDGAAIRHATARLAQHRARTKLLILLSDGRPLDCGCDQYYDRYANDDTRIALREARNAGIHPFCITVDPRARKYLEELYGEVGYIVIDDVGSLPHRLPTIYRRLTR